MSAMPARRSQTEAPAVSLVDVQRRVEAIERRCDELRAAQERSGEILRVELGAMRQALEGLRSTVESLGGVSTGLKHGYAKTSPYCAKITARPMKGCGAN